MDLNDLLYNKLFNSTDNFGETESIDDWFTQPDNVDYLTLEILRRTQTTIYRGVNSNTHVDPKLRKLVQHHVNLVKQRGKLRQYAGVKNNPMSMLDFLNEEFIRSFIRVYFKKTHKLESHADVLNQELRESVKLARERKAFDDLPDAMSRLGQPQDSEVFRTNQQFRYGNRIPYYQYTLVKRHYDTQPDGLRVPDPELSSRDNFVRGYDMNSMAKIKKEKRQKSQKYYAQVGKHKFY